MKGERLMDRFIAGVRRFLREEEGSEVVEWALVCGLIVAVGALVFTQIGTEAARLLQNVANLLAGA
jgi:pilus assembly protein Flp/PilA